MPSTRRPSQRMIEGTFRVVSNHLAAATCLVAQEDAYSYAQRLYPRSAETMKKPPYLSGPAPVPPAMRMCRSSGPSRTIAASILNAIYPRMQARELGNQDYSFSYAPLLGYPCFTRRASHETANRTAHHRYCCYRESDRKLDPSRSLFASSARSFPSCVRSRVSNNINFRRRNPHGFKTLCRRVALCGN